MRAVPEIGDLPSTESTSKGAMQSLPPALVGHFLLPDGHVGAIVAYPGIERGQRSPVHRVRRLLRLVGLKGGA